MFKKDISGFIIRFTIVYFSLIGLYSWYLKAYSSISEGITDPYTLHISKMSNGILTFLGYDSYYIPRYDNNSIKIIFEGLYITEVIEGCNAFSVIILFLSLLFGLYIKNLKQTLLFGLIGVFILYSMNILRIAGLNIAGYYLPVNFFTVFHDVFFPLVIYGTLFCLLILWIMKHTNKLKL